MEPGRMLPAVVLDLGAEVLLGEAADRGGPVWLVLGDAPRCGHPVLDGALRLVPDAGSAPPVGPLRVRGEVSGGARMLRWATVASVVPGVVAVLLTVREHTGRSPRLSCRPPERHLLAALVGAVFGVGSAPDGIRRLVRRAEPDPARRPTVHVW